MAIKKQRTFTRGVLSITSMRNFDKNDIINALHEDKGLRKKINGIISMANKRLDRLNNSNFISTAQQQLRAERGNNRFSISGLSWDHAKAEYSRAVSFLSNPTSTVTGARQYTRSIANSLHTDLETATRLIGYVTQPTIASNGSLNAFKYRGLIEHLKEEYDSTDFGVLDKDTYAEELENSIYKTAEDFIRESDKFMNDLISSYRTRGF